MEETAPVEQPTSNMDFQDSDVTQSISQEDRPSKVNMLEGWALAKKGEYEKGIELLNQALQEDPDNVEILDILGKVYYHQGKKKDARQCWAQALKLSPGDSVAYSCLHRSKSQLPHHLMILITLLSLAAAGWLYVQNRALQGMVGGKAKPQPVAKPAPPAKVSSKAQVRKSAKSVVSQVVETQVAVPLSIAEPTLTPEPVSPTETPVPIVGILPIPRPEDLEAAPTPRPIMITTAPTAKPMVVSTSTFKDTEEVTSRYQEALKAFENRDYAGCKAILTELEKNGVSPGLLDNVLFWLGQTEYIQGNAEPARAYFERILAETPQENKAPEARVMIGLCYMKAGMNEEAKKAFEEALASGQLTESLANTARKRLETLNAAPAPETPQP